MKEDAGIPAPGLCDARESSLKRGEEPEEGGGAGGNAAQGDSGGRNKGP